MLLKYICLGVIVICILLINIVNEKTMHQICSNVEIINQISI